MCWMQKTVSVPSGRAFGGGDVNLAPLGDQEWPSDIAHLRQDFAGKLNVYRVMREADRLSRDAATASPPTPNTHREG